jgi:hypothetical protein
MKCPIPPVRPIEPSKKVFAFSYLHRFNGFKSAYLVSEITAAIKEIENKFIQFKTVNDITKSFQDVELSIGNYGVTGALTFTKGVDAAEKSNFSAQMIVYNDAYRLYQEQVKSYQAHQAELMQKRKVKYKEKKIEKLKAELAKLEGDK